MAGIKFQYTLDALAPTPTWTSTTALSTATSLLLLDGPISQESTGLTLNFAAGTLNTGDVAYFNTTGPVPNSAGITQGLSGPTPQTNPPTGLQPWNGEWTFARLVGPQPESVVATAASIIAAWDSSNAAFAWGVADARDHGSTELLPAWSTRVQAEYAAYTSKWLGVSAGMARVTCPINGRNNRRAAMCASGTARAVGWPIFWDWARLDQGALPPDVSIENLAGQIVEHNANTDPGLNAMGFITLRTWPGRAGFYPTQACLLGPDNDIKLVPLRRVINVAKEIQQSIQQLQAVIDLKVYLTGDPKIPRVSPRATSSWPTSTRSSDSGTTSSRPAWSPRGSPPATRGPSRRRPSRSAAGTTSSGTRSRSPPRSTS